MRYVALLRGINVGGNAIIKMADLKTAFENCGYGNVKTYIQSGNVIFESNKNIDLITKILEATLSDKFNYTAVVMVVTADQFKHIVGHVPKSWTDGSDVRKYIAFIKAPMTAEAALKEIKLTEGIDFANVGLGVIYMTTKKSGLMRSGFTKIIGKPVYKQLTMRNFNTTQKILALLET